MLRRRLTALVGELHRLTASIRETLQGEGGLGEGGLAAVCGGRGSVIGSIYQTTFKKLIIARTDKCWWPSAWSRSSTLTATQPSAIWLPEERGRALASTPFQRTAVSLMLH